MSSYECAATHLAAADQAPLTPVFRNRAGIRCLEVFLYISGHEDERGRSGTCVPEYPLGVAMKTRRIPAKTIFGLLLAVVMVAAFATAGSAENTGNPRSGDLHVTKECSQFNGLPGGFCTITGSNLNAIDAGMKVVYTNTQSLRIRPPG